MPSVVFTGTASETFVSTLTGTVSPWILQITNITGHGTIIPSIAAGTVHDAAGNTNALASGTPITVLRLSQNTKPYRFPDLLRSMSHFIDSSIGMISSRLWNYGDNSIDTLLVNPVHTFANSGTYTVKLTVKGPVRADSATTLITVTDTTRPLPVTGITAIALNCSTSVVKWVASTSPDVGAIFVCASAQSAPADPQRER